MLKYIFCYLMISIFVHKGFAELPDHVHVHTKEELAETNYVVLNKPDICKPSQNGNNDIIIAIKMAPWNRLQRDLIRQTWLADVVKHRIPYVFLMGATNDEQLFEELLMEDQKYKDLLIGKPIDNYFNLTLKGIFLLAWTNAYCPTRWLLYVDEDTILNAQYAINFVTSMKNTTDHAIYCRILNQPVIRHPDSKWYMPKSIFEPDYYDPYCHGNGYLIPPHIVPLLHAATINDTVKPKIWIEDVYITGIVTKTVGIKLIPSAFYCCGGDAVTLFNESILLEEMGKGEEFRIHWKLIKRNSTHIVKSQSKIIASLIQTPHANGKEALVTTQTQKCETFLTFTTNQYFSEEIDYSIPNLIIFLIIVAFLLFIVCRFFGKCKFVGSSMRSL